ncbi:hypothetical protein DPMN_107665 [Dreissena polymorpha]|uniref:Uncharacterized protein n=1 Tax=Dreissena polymorpha TaxID=45954 RepID=A0A9D4K7K7_DREPO|nr:hypothetical protein DPMN_107665 [Dreissena polymorpha]
MTHIEQRIKLKMFYYRKHLTPCIKFVVPTIEDSYHHLMCDFRVAHNAISKIICQVCNAIFE